MIGYFLREISSLGFANLGKTKGLYWVGHPMEDDSCWSEAMDRVRELHQPYSRLYILKRDIKNLQV